MLVEFIIGSVIFVYAAYLYVKKKYAYFKDRGIPYDQPVFPFGSTRNIFKGEHHAYLTQKVYTKLKDKGPVSGVFAFLAPVLMVTDLELVKSIFTSEFQHFHDRSVFFNERDDPLSANLVSLQGLKWKNLRNKLTPTFSASKIKQMVPLMDKIGDQLIESMHEIIKKNPVVIVNDMFEKYTIDVIGSCAFGIECNSIKNPDAKFRKMWTKVLEDYIFVLKFILLSPMVKMATWLRIRLFSKKISSFFINVVRESLEYRLKNKVTRPDLIDSLIKLVKKSEFDFLEHVEEDESEKLTVNQIAAEVFVYFLAGFDTSSTTLTFTFFELARHPQYQTKLREHVKQVIAKYNNEVTFEAIGEMTYLDQCICEGLRKFPPAPVTSRLVTKDFTIPRTDITLKKDDGICVIIPIYSIHNDPEYHPNPEVYNPDRFSPEEKSKRDPFTFMPFGAGPRICPGYRFAMTQIKLVMCKVLLNFHISATTDIQITYGTNKGTVIPKEGVPLKFTPL